MAKAQAFVLWCKDLRIQSSVIDWLYSLGLKHKYDPDNQFGGVLDLVSREDDRVRGKFLRDVQKSISMHGISQVILVNHLDCGAYGGSTAFASEREERKRHVDDLHQARQIVKARFPELEVLLFLGRKVGDSEFNWDFEHVI